MREARNRHRHDPFVSEKSEISTLKLGRVIDGKVLMQEVEGGLQIRSAVLDNTVYCLLPLS